jgi:hypothetical protein
VDLPRSARLPVSDVALRISGPFLRAVKAAEPRKSRGTGNVPMPRPSRAVAPVPIRSQGSVPTVLAATDGRRQWPPQFLLEMARGGTPLF